MTAGQLIEALSQYHASTPVCVGSLNEVIDLNKTSPIRIEEDVKDGSVVGLILWADEP